MQEVSKAELAKHASEDDCWIAVDGSVYDVTAFLSEHPGGGEPIMDCAGKDCTRQFAEIGHSDGALELREKYFIGRLEGAAPLKTKVTVDKNADLKEISLEELAKHNTQEDCWIAVHGLVYNMTNWLAKHPGGDEPIMDCAGLDCSRQFDEIGHSEKACGIADTYVIGKLKGASNVKRLIDPNATKVTKTNPNLPGDNDAYIFAASATAAAVVLGAVLFRYF